MDALWTRLAALSAPADKDQDRQRAVLRCVRLELGPGATFDVYKADDAGGAVTLWRVRGFLETAGAPVQELQAAVLGTKDGRAMVRFSAAQGGMRPVRAHHETTRALSDLSSVVASAVRRLMDPGSESSS